MAIDIFVDDPEQAAFEAAIMEVFQTAEVQEQVNVARKLFAADPLAQKPAGRARLEGSLGENVRAALDRVVNADPLRPSLVWVETPAHKWFGVDFPGNRWGIDNPDNLYAGAAIDGNSRYEITGKWRHPMPAEFTLTVSGYGGPYPEAFPHSNAYLGVSQIQTDADGSFVVTVGPEPAGGRPNHMQSRPESLGLIVRNSLGDWTTETPPLVSIRRLGDPPATPAPTRSEMARKAVEVLRKFVPAMLEFNRKSTYRQGANTLTPPSPTPGGLLTQMTCFGHFEIADDEALLLTIDPVGAAYLGFQLYDHWGVSMEYVSATGSLNHAQSARNADGTYTLVISPTDPGVHNWVDTEKMNSGAMLIRWQALPSEPKAMDPAIAKTQLVKLSRLTDTLPEGTKMVTADERRRQLEEREKGYARRIGQLRR